MSGCHANVGTDLCGVVRGDSRPRDVDCHSRASASSAQRDKRPHVAIRGIYGGVPTADLRPG